MSQWVKTTDLSFKTDSKSVIISDGSYYVRGYVYHWHWFEDLERSLEIGRFLDSSNIMYVSRPLSPIVFSECLITLYLQPGSQHQGGFFRS